jgi:hypothetical protein
MCAVLLRFADKFRLHFVHATRYIHLILRNLINRPTSLWYSGSVIATEPKIPGFKLDQRRWIFENDGIP